MGSEGLLQFLETELSNEICSFADEPKVRILMGSEGFEPP